MEIFRNDTGNSFAGEILACTRVPVKEYRCIFRSKCKNWIVAWLSLFALFGTFLEIIHFEREKKGDVI